MAHQVRRSGAADEALCGAVGGAALWTRLADTLGAQCRARTLPPTPTPTLALTLTPSQPQPEPTVPGEQWGGGEGGGGEG